MHAKSRGEKLPKMGKPLRKLPDCVLRKRLEKVFNKGNKPLPPPGY